MKRKALIDLIKTKANEVEVKDFSASILERAKSLPHKEVVDVQKRRQFLSLKPAMLAMTFVFAIILAFAIFYEPTSTPPVTPTIEAYEDAIALSAMSSASLVTFENESLHFIDETSLLMLSHSLNTTPTIDQEVNHITKYLETIEKLLATQAGFNVRTEVPNQPGANRSMRFKTNDFLEEEVEYTLSYQESYDPILERFNLNGQLIIGSQMLQMSVVIDEKENLIIFKAAKSSDAYVEVMHHIQDDVNHYQITKTHEGQIESIVDLTIAGESNEKTIELKFVEGEAKGRYLFHKDIENSSPVLRIDYVIENESTESGELIIRILRNQDNAYQIMIKPQGGIPYFIDRARGFTEHRGRLPIIPNL